MKGSVSVYFVKTELEALAAEIIATQFESESLNVLAYSGKSSPFFIKPNVFKISIEFARIKQKGFLSEKKAVCKSLEELSFEIKKLTSDPENIYIHIPRLSTSKTNYAINYFIKKFPSSTVCVRLIPHGIVSINLIPLTFSKRLKLLRRKYHPTNLVFPFLRYYPPRHDLIGGSDKIVDRVYTFKGISTPYVSEKVVEISGVKNYIQGIQNNNSIRSAVVIGQPLIKNGLITDEDHAFVKREILDWLKYNSYQIVYYSKHPRSGDILDFYDKKYRIIEQEGAVEVFLCKIQPDVVISCFSTALATAKVLLGDDVRAISFGLELTQTDKKKEISTFFKSIGVEML